MTKVGREDIATMGLNLRSTNFGDDFSERRLVALPQPERRSLWRLAVRNNGHVVFLTAGEIEWIEAAGNYVRLNAGGECHLLRETMSRVESKLPRDRFLRIHRSAIVNLEAVRELVPSPHGDFVVVLRSGKRLPLSRGLRDLLEEALGTA